MTFKPNFGFPIHEYYLSSSFHILFLFLSDTINFF